MIKITCDFREKRSTIPELLANQKADISFSSLSIGDYIINDQLIVERKTAEDFIKSIINNRLFEQCSTLKKSTQRILFLLEGNPYLTSHRIESAAIRGAILSILTAWQIPIIYSQNIDCSVGILMTLGAQSLKNFAHLRITKNYKPKKIKNQKLRFLQDIPSTGPTLAIRLMDYFGNIKSIVNASAEDLNKIKGLGKKNTKRIIDFFSE